jgi:dimethylglycine dehydrogenase
LQTLTNASLETADFPFMRSRMLEIAGVDCLALRVSFTGDLGWELHCAADDQVRLYTALAGGGRALGGGPVGARALMSLRIEKGYGSWSREYSPEYYPHEVGLAGCARWTRSSCTRRRPLRPGARPREELVLLHLDEADTAASNADATGGEPIFRDGQGVGRVTSGAYGYSVGMSLALGYVKSGQAGPATRSR